MDVSWTKTHEEQMLSTGLRDGDPDSERTPALPGHNSRQGFLMPFLIYFPNVLLSCGFQFAFLMRFPNVLLYEPGIVLKNHYYLV